MDPPPAAAWQPLQLNAVYSRLPSAIAYALPWKGLSVFVSRGPFGASGVSGTPSAWVGVCAVSLKRLASRSQDRLVPTVAARTSVTTHQRARDPRLFIWSAPLGPCAG